MNKKKEEEKQPVPGLINPLMQALSATYEPVAQPGPNVELFTTHDILSQMAAIVEIDICQVAAAMQAAGFSITHNEAGFFWMLKRRSTE